MDILAEIVKQFRTMYKNLKLLREERNWSVDELSQISGIDKKTLVAIESEEDFEIEFLFVLCRIYGVRVHRIFSSFDPDNEDQKQNGATSL